MSNIRRFVVALLLSAGVSSVSVVGWTQEKAAPKKNRAAAGPVDALKRELERLELTAEQKPKVEGILKEHQPKVEAAQQKLSSLLTPDQRKARREATAKARSEGKKGREIADAVATATNLTPDQRKALEDAEKGLREATTALRKAVGEALTPEQRAKLQPGGPRRKSKA